MHCYVKTLYLEFLQLHSRHPALQFVDDFTLSKLADCFHLVQVNVYGNEIPDVSALTEHDILVNYDPTVKE